jgi:rod shape-determining protein MreD
MKKFKGLIFALLYAIVSIVIQSVLVASGAPVWLIPDFVILLVLFLGFYEISPLGALVAFCVGLILDISGGALLGPWAGAYVLSFGMLTMVSEHVFAESKLSLFPIAFFFVIIAHILFLLPAFDPLGQLATDWPRLLGKALITAILAPVVFKLLSILIVPARIEIRRSGPIRRY